MKQIFFILKTNTLMLLIILALSIVMFPATTRAAADPRCEKSVGFLRMPTWFKYLDVTYDESTSRCDVVGPTHEVEVERDGRKVKEQKFDWQAASGRIALAVFEIILRVAALIAIGFIIYGGISYIISQGEPDRTKNAKGTILNALIGLVVAMLAVAIVNLVAGTLIT